METWVEEGRALYGEGTKDAEELWQFASASIGTQVRMTVRKIIDNDYTREEEQLGIENVRTGLLPKQKKKRKIASEVDEEDEDEESDGDSDDDEDEEMQDADSNDAKEPVEGRRTLEEMVRFATTGRAP